MRPDLSMAAAPGSAGNGESILCYQQQNEHHPIHCCKSGTSGCSMHAAVHKFDCMLCTASPDLRR